MTAESENVQGVERKICPVKKNALFADWFLKGLNIAQINLRAKK